MSVVCPALQIPRGEARDHLRLFDGLRQVHIARLNGGQMVSWPEVEEQEKAAIRDRMRAMMGL